MDGRSLIRANHTSGRKPTFILGRIIMTVDVDKIRGICNRVAASLGLEIVEVQFRGSGKSRLLRIFIDRPFDKNSAASASPAVVTDLVTGEARIWGVTHEDCARLSREVSTILDIEDTVPGDAYTLEVSSPGLDRKLSNAADFDRFTGKRVKLMTRQPIAGNRHFQGRLEKFADGRITLDLAPEGRKPKKESDSLPEKLEIGLDNIETANLVPEF